MSQTLLPVDEIRPQFDALLATLPRTTPLVLTAPTGSGKSTRLPLWLAETASADRPVWVIEPRRVAARALAQYLASQRKEQVGQSIGYAIRFESKRSAHTRVIFMTPGVALRMLSDPLATPSAIVLDEFHERGWETDLIAALVRQKQADLALDAPLILTSATLEAQALIDDLGAHLIEASGRTYPVTIDYQAQTSMPSSEDLEGRVARAIRHILSVPDDEGEILVFLPGKSEIDAASRAIEALGAPKLLCLPVHASLPGAQLMKIFEPPKPGIRRVFLATNVAETSLTLPGVTWVLDSGLARMTIHRGGQIALALVPISQASMDQRSGRAGRVKPGRAIRLWDRNWAPDPATSPELLRMELDDVLLRTAACGTPTSRIHTLPWVSQPPEFATTRATARLIRIKAITAPEGALTPYGETLAGLPVSAYEARLLVDPPRDLAGALADLVALMQRGGSLLLPLGVLRDEAAVKAARFDLLQGCIDEVSEAIRVLRGGHTRHGVRRTGLEEARKLARSLRAMIGASALCPTKDKDPWPVPDVLATHVIARAPELGFVLRSRAKGRESRHGQPWANGQVEVMWSPYIPPLPEDRGHPLATPVAGAMLRHVWLGRQGGRQVSGRGSFLLPCTLSQLNQALGDHAEQEVGQLQCRRSRGRWQIRAQLKRTHAGVVLEQAEKPLQGRALRQAAATLIKENRLFKGTWPRLLDALHTWSILSQWDTGQDPAQAHWTPGKLGDPPEDPEAHLAQTLERLGLELAEDLDLLEPEDLLPDLLAQSGMFEPELVQVQDTFPRLWTHLGAQYLCHVHPRRRTVVLEPVNQAAKKAKDPTRDVLPRFEGFRVDFKQASRVVRLR